MKYHILIGALLVILAGTSCQQSQQQNQTNTNTTSKTQSTLQTDTAKAYSAYLAVKDNLVKSDGKAAKQAADELAEALNSIKGCSEASDLASRMAATDDVKSQRLLFLQLSHDFIPLIKGMKNKAAPVYLAYCPMANEGKGGYWLSAQKEIKNPYYGDEMLECGEVKEEIK